MSNKQTVGPAFPCKFTNDSDVNITAPDGQVVYPGGTVDMQGMSLRVYLAGQAMQGLCATATAHYDKGPCNAAIVERAYVLADLMLAARNQ